MYSNNDNHGIQLIDIAGDVTLVRTTVDNNDANNGGIGDGVNAMDGTDGDLVAVGGNLSVQGARLRRLSGPNDYQRNGMAVTSVAGSVTFQDSTGTVQSMDVTGNMTNGVLITDGGTTATFTNGTYSNTGTAAGHDGIDLASFSGAVTLTGVAADTNADTGIRVATTAGLSATNTSASNNTTAGLQASSLTGAVTVDGGTYNTNGDGIAITTAPSAAVSGATRVEQHRRRARGSLPSPGPSPSPAARSTTTVATGSASPGPGRWWCPADSTRPGTSRGCWSRGGVVLGHRRGVFQQRQPRDPVDRHRG